LDIGNVHTIDTRLQKDVVEFFDTCQQYFPTRICIPDTDLKIYVGRLPGPSIGECNIYSDKKLRVIIDKEILSERNRRLVVFHELIHCVFDVDHYNDSVDIMNEDSKHDQEIMDHFDFYVEKVFRRLQREMFKK
jgi:hypothetical protein